MHIGHPFNQGAWVDVGTDVVCTVSEHERAASRKLYSLKIFQKGLSLEGLKSLLTGAIKDRITQRK